jgi:hypothetical protein
MGKFTGYEKTGFNTTGNNQSSMSNYNQGRSIYAVGLGRTRSTIGSITRKFNYCNLTAPDLNVAFRCTFDLPYKESESGKYITIVCQNGSILVSSDGGLNFTPKSTIPPISSLFQVSMSETGRFQLVSDVDVDTGNSIFISYDFGKTFIEPKTLPTSNLAYISLAISRTGRYQTVVSKQNDNSVYYSLDFGKNWKTSNELKFQNEKLQIIGVSMNNLGTVQIALCISPNNTTSYLYISRDFGINWSYLENSQIVKTLFSINFADNGLFITAGELQSSGVNNTSIWYGYIDNDKFIGWYKSTVNSPTTPSIFNIVSAFYGKKQMAIGGYSFGQNLNKSYLYISEDYGVTWNPANINIPGFPPQENLYWLSCSISQDNLKLVALACDTISNLGSGDIPDVTGKFYYYYSFDGGITWKATQLPSNYPGVGIFIN